MGIRRDGNGDGYLKAGGATTIMGCRRVILENIWAGKLKLLWRWVLFGWQESVNRDYDWIDTLYAQWKNE